MKLVVTEMRLNEKGEQFAVDTIYDAPNALELRKRIDKKKPSSVVDKKYKIKKY